MADWMDQAACLNADLDAFFPNTPSQITATARQLCAGCPVADRCLQHALEHGITDGIWGGMTPDDRRRHANRTGQPRHGTTTGYTVDRCRCQSCRDVMADSKRRSRTRAGKEPTDA